MKKILAIAVFALSLGASAVEELFVDEEWAPHYVSAAAGVLLPGDGAKLDPAAAVRLGAGYYTTDTFAWEGGLSYVPRARGAKDGSGAILGVGAGGLWHWWGFERLDPFFTFGAEAMFSETHPFGDSSHRSAIGPYLGAGTFWHLSETAGLRFESRMLLGVDGPCEILYSVAAGLQFGW